MVRNAKIAEDKLLEDGEENIVYDQEDEVLQETAVVSKLRKESQQLSRAGSYILSVSKRSSLDESNYFSYFLFFSICKQLFFSNMNL